MSTTATRPIVAVTNTSPLAPAIVAHLSGMDLAELRLIGGDSAIGKRDRQRVTLYRDALPDEPAGAALSRLLADRLGVVPLRSTPMPGARASWRQAIEGAALVVAPVDGPMPFLPWVDDLNVAALEARLPWITAGAPDHEEVKIGPTFVPGVTACHTCYEKRFKSHVLNHDAYLHFQAYLRANPGLEKDFGFLPPVADLAAALVAMEVGRALAPEGTPHTVGALVTLSLSSFAFTTHPVLPLPRCEVCGLTRAAVRA